MVFTTLTPKLKTLVLFMKYHFFLLKPKLFNLIKTTECYFDTTFNTKELKNNLLYAFSLQPAGCMLPSRRFCATQFRLSLQYK